MTTTSVSQHEQIAPFNTLCLGAKFRYPNSDWTWVKIAHDLVAKWDPSLITATWVGQAICSFSEDDDLTAPVHLVDDTAAPTFENGSSDLQQTSLTREQQIVAMADVLRGCRWFGTPDGVSEDQELIWATNMWEAANPSPENFPTVKLLSWTDSNPTLKAGLLGQHYLIHPSRIIDRFQLSTPDGTYYFPTIEAAKAAAQVDLERRIASVFVRPTGDAEQGGGRPHGPFHLSRSSDGHANWFSARDAASGVTIPGKTEEQAKNVVEALNRAFALHLRLGLAKE